MDAGMEQGTGRPPRGASRTVRAGFIPLVDCAVLVAAVERGFARAENIDLRLERDVSWANIRDKVNLGHLDCAQMLAGMPIASSLGIGHVRVPMIAPMALGLNGNAITVSAALYARMAATGKARDGDPAAMVSALADVVAEDRAAGREPMTFGMVFPFSCHNYELRYWLAAGGLRPDRDVRLVVIPPPLIVESLKAGHIQGFCVGAPWNSIAVEEGLGRIVATKSQIWPRSPEKVLGLQTGWAARNPETLAALIRALERAAAWADAPENRAALADMLGRPDYVGVDAGMLRQILDGDIPLGDGGPQLDNSELIVFQRHGATVPRTACAMWLYSQMVRWRQIEPSRQAEAAARAAFRPDIHASALGVTAAQASGAGASLPLFDGLPFDPDDVAGYLARLDA